MKYLQMFRFITSQKNLNFPHFISKFKIKLSKNINIKKNKILKALPKK